MPDGTLVRLAAVRQADSAAMFGWINNRELVLLSAPYRPVGEDAHRHWFDSVQKRSDNALFCIRLIADDQLIGTCQLVGVDRIHRSAGLQIRIGAAPMRRRGYGTEAVRLLVRHGFNDLNLHRIELGVFAHNEAALRAYEKAGFVVEGCRREAVWIDGRFCDLVLMALLKSQWHDGAHV